MSRKYKMNNPNGAYFVSFATVYWVDVFIREIYFQAVIESLDFCRKNKGMLIYGYCIMPSHIHLLFQAKENNPTELLRDFKKFTANLLLKLIRENQQESGENGYFECLNGLGKSEKI